MRRILWTAAMVALLTAYGCAAESSDSAGPGSGSEAEASEAESSEGFLSNILDLGREEVTVPAGTVLQTTLDAGLSSDGSEAGDEFTATLRQALVIDGKTVVPARASLRGRVTEARESGKVEGRARLQFHLTSILHEDETVDIETRPFAMEAEPDTGRDAATIAGATGIGAAIGAIAGGGDGAAVGAAAGAGAGTGAVLLTRGEEVRLGAETPINFELAEAVDVAVAETE